MHRKTDTEKNRHREKQKLNLHNIRIDDKNLREEYQITVLESNITLNATACILIVSNSCIIKFSCSGTSLVARLMARL